MKRQPSIPNPIAFRHRFVCRVWVLLCAVLIPSSWNQAQVVQSSPPRPQLLLPADAATTTAPISSLRSRPGHVRQLRLNPELASRGGDWLRPGQEIRLDLLERQNVTVAIESVDSTATGGQVIRGRATSDEASSVTLTLEGRSLTGFVRLDGLGAFRIAPQGAGELLEVSRVDARPHAFCGTIPQAVPTAADVSGIARAGVALNAQDLPPADTLPDPTVVDVMFLYTPQAVIGEGSEEGIRNRILESVNETNVRLTNSLINVRIHPIFIGLYNTFETGDLPRDNYRLANGLDGMERVPQIRNDYKADLVCLITELENQGIGGQAWDLTPPKGNHATGFTVIRRPFLGRGYMVLAHELGHLLGCAHDREHAGEVDSEFYRARKPYIFGHRFQVEGVTYVDVMSYEPGIYVPYFGNPQLALDGVPLGVTDGQPRPSDGARTINETAPYVANYRVAQSRIEFADARVVASEQSGSVTIRLVRRGDLNTSARSTVLFEPASSAKPGQDYIRPTPALVAFATNQAVAEIEIPLLSDDLAEGEESLRLSLGSLLGNHGIGPGGSCEVVILDASTPAALSQVEFPEGPLVVAESAGQAAIQVRSAHPNDQGQTEPLVLPYRTADGTAVAGLDYQTVSGTVTNDSGASEWTIRVPVLNRPDAGPDRVFSLIVGTRTNEVRILDEQRSGVLRDNPGRDLAADGDLNAKVRGDGKLLVWGSFSRLAGQERTGVALLNADGTLDASFRSPEILLGHRRLDRIGNPSPNAAVAVVEVQPDGKLILAGNFSRIDGKPRSTLVRLNSDGSVDESFGKNLQFDGAIYAIARQDDGRLVVGGSFEHINGVRRAFIARLLGDGTVDDSFQPQGGPTSDWTVIIQTVALQTDGKILMGGYFQKVDGKSLLNLARLNADGTLDTTFKLRTGASGPVWRIRVQADGKIALGGVFDSVGGRTSQKVARLNADGSNDLSFRPPNPNADVNDLVCLPDGRMLLAGNFTSVGGKYRRFVALLNPNGTLDPSFDAGMGTDQLLGLFGSQLGASSEATPVHADGSVFLAGSFQRFNGVYAPNLVRLDLGPLEPRLQGANLTHGDLQAKVHGLPGGIYPIQSSDDLKKWQPAGEVRLEGYRTEAKLTATPTTPGRFFRLQSPAP